MARRRQYPGEAFEVGAPAQTGGQPYQPYNPAGAQQGYGGAAQQGYGAQPQYGQPGAYQPQQGAPGGGYPPQGGHQPQQGGYQGGYQPQQGGYEPQQGGYQPQGAGYGAPPPNGAGQAPPPAAGGYPSSGYGAPPPPQGYGQPPAQAGYPGQGQAGQGLAGQQNVPKNPLADVPFRANEHVMSGKGQSSVPSAGYPAYGQPPLSGRAVAPPPAASAVGGSSAPPPAVQQPPPAGQQPPPAQGGAAPPSGGYPQSTPQPAAAASPAAAAPPPADASAGTRVPGQRRVYAELSSAGDQPPSPSQQQIPMMSTPGYSAPAVASPYGSSPSTSPYASANQYSAPQGGYGGAPTPWTPSEEAQCPDAFMRTTMSTFPMSDKLLLQTGLPLGAVIEPMAVPDEKIPVVNFPASGIVRCRKCRAYINPFARFIESGKRWRCNLCAYVNEVPSDYYCMVGNDGKRYDVNERKELCTGCVEIIAPAEYMVRPPQPSVYFFVIDVTYTAVTTGMLAATVSAIRRCLDRLAEDERTKVGFIAFDEHVHFFNLRSTLSAPQMLVVPDISVYASTPFVPLQDDLLVNFNESRAVVESLLEKLPQMYANTKAVESALGSAISAATAVVKPVGGKILLCTSTLPSVGVGKLRIRQTSVTPEDETEKLRLADQWYKTLALEQSRVQVSTDVFLFAPKYVDAASLGVLPRITGGQLFYYNLAGKDNTQGGRRLDEDLASCIRRETGFEAVMRVRCTKGIKVRDHFGNFFVRTNDLLALPNIDRDKSIAVHLEINDPKELSLLKQRGDNHVTVQAALLYTTSSGQRRIRSMTKCIPLSNVLADIYQGVHLDTCMNLFARIALEKALSSSLGDARQAIMNKCVDILAKYQRGFSQQGAQQLICPNTLNAFPMMTLALIKSSAFRQGSEISLDERTAVMHAIRSGPADVTRRFVYPDMYALGALPAEAGRSNEQGELVMPPAMELASERIDRRGVFLLDNGIELLMWVGKSAHPDLLRALFNIQSLEEVDAHNTQLQLVPYDNEYSQRVNAVVDRVRARYPTYRQLYAFKEGDRGEQYFFSFFVHDRMRGNYSYPEFLRELQRTVLSKAWK